MVLAYFAYLLIVGKNIISSTNCGKEGEDMQEWKPSKWAMWVTIAGLSGLLGMWIFRHYTVNGLAQLIGIGISSGVMAVVSMIRSETIRWQDSHMRRIDNTSKVLPLYNNEIRKIVLEFMQKFTSEKSKLSNTLMPDPKTGKIDREYEVTLAVRFELATILHLLDHLAWLLKQKNYLYSDEILYAVASELKRLLLAKDYRYAIIQLRQHSTLRNLDYLIDKIQEVPTNDAN